MIVYGKQVFFYILQRHKEVINELYLARECDKVTSSLIAEAGFKIKKLDLKSAQALARGGNHQGFLVDIKESDFVPFCELKKSKFIVMLCRISDVGNIGAITYTAYALGIDGLLFMGKNLAQEGIVRPSSGAAPDLPICLSNDALSASGELKQMGFKLYGADGKGREVHYLTFPKGKGVLIVRSEGFGLSSKVIQKCDECVGITMQSDFDSLSVSAAFTILCDRVVHAKL